MLVQDVSQLRHGQVLRVERDKRVITVEVQGFPWSTTKEFHPTLGELDRICIKPSGGRMPTWARTIFGSDLRKVPRHDEYEISLSSLGVGVEEPAVVTRILEDLS